MSQDFNNQTKENKKSIGLIIIIILALVIGGSLAHFYYFKSDSKSSFNTDTDSEVAAGTFCTVNSDCQYDCGIEGCLEGREATSECVKSKCECGCLDNIP